MLNPPRLVCSTAPSIHHHHHPVIHCSSTGHLPPSYTRTSSDFHHRSSIIYHPTSTHPSIHLSIHPSIHPLISSSLSSPRLLVQLLSHVHLLLLFTNVVFFISPYFPASTRHHARTRITHYQGFVENDFFFFLSGFFVVCYVFIYSFSFFFRLRCHCCCYNLFF